MAIGLASDLLNMERREVKDYYGMQVKEYWKWWQSVSPFRCADIRTEGTSSNVCRRLGQIAATKTEDLIKTVKV